MKFCQILWKIIQDSGFNAPLSCFSKKKKNAPPNKCKLINTIINLWTFVIFFLY